MSFPKHSFAAPFQHANTLIWLQTAFIGDIILTSAAITLVHRLRPDIKQILITTAIGKEVLGDTPGLNAVVVFEKRNKSSLAAFAQVKREIKQLALPTQRTVLLQAHTSFRSSLLARYLGHPTITFGETSGGWLASHRVPRVALFHEAIRIALLLEPLGFKREAITACRPSLAKPRELGEPLGQRTLIAIAPGSVWATKRWPADYFAALIPQLATLPLPAIELVLLGSPGEAELVASIIARLPEQGRNLPLKNLAGKTSIADLKKIYPRLALVISGDSSPVHFASAYNIPTLAIFGPTVPAMGFAPLADRNSIVEHRALSCRPCSAHGPQSCPLGHFRCMRELPSELVLARCRELLGLA